MNTKLDAKLCKKYPNLYRDRGESMQNTAMCWGFQRGDGWYDLLREAAEKLRGYSDRDVWGWYNHHAEIMVGILQYLRKYKHGYPIGLTPGKWTKVLLVMEQGFQAIIDGENDMTSYKRLSSKEQRKLIFKRRRKLMLGLKYFRTYYYNLWD